PRRPRRTGRRGSPTRHCGRSTIRRCPRTGGPRRWRGGRRGVSWRGEGGGGERGGGGGGGGVGGGVAPQTCGSRGVLRGGGGGAMPGVPRIGLEVVDVRDLADLHIRAMTVPEAAGERFLGTGEFVWMRAIAQTLRDGLGAAGTKVSTRQIPDVLVRLTSLWDR